MNKIKERRRVEAICDVCRSPDYKYLGRVFGRWSKHQFKCGSCNSIW